MPISVMHDEPVVLALCWRKELPESAPNEKSVLTLRIIKRNKTMSIRLDPTRNHARAHMKQMGCINKPAHCNLDEREPNVIDCLRLLLSPAFP